MRQTRWETADWAVKGLLWVVSILIMLPVLLMLGGVFWDGGPTLTHVAAVYGDTARILVLLRNSLTVCALTLLVSLVPGIPLGFLVFRTRLPGRRLLILGSMLTVCFPLYVTATAWTALIGNEYWFSLDYWFQKALLAGTVQGLAWLPAVVLITGVTFAAGEPALEEQGLMDSAWRRVFRRISLPQAAWGIGAAAMLVLVLSLSDITIASTLRLRTFAEETYTQFQLPDIQPGTGEAAARVKPWRAAAVALPVIALLGGLLWLFRRRWREFGQATRSGSERHPRKAPLGSWRWPLGILCILSCAAVLLVPLAALVRAVGSWRNMFNAVSATGSEILYTLILAPVAATLAALLALVWAEGLLRRFGAWLWAAVILLLAVPAPLLGIGLIMCLNNRIFGWLYDSPAVLVLAWVTRALPYAVLVLLPAVRRIPTELREEARLAGAGWLQRLLFVVMPLAWRGLLCAWLLSFVLSIGELGASVLVCPPGQSTLTIRFFTLIHYGVYSNVAGLCLIVLGVVILPGALLSWLLWRLLRRRYI